MEKLTPEEKELLEGLALACHEELVKGASLKNAVKMCNKCKKHIPFTAACTVYSEWIPDEALLNGCPEFEEK